MVNHFNLLKNMYKISCEQFQTLKNIYLHKNKNQNLKRYTVNFAYSRICIRQKYILRRKIFKVMQNDF